MADQRSKTPTTSPDSKPRSGTTTTQPPVSEIADEDRIVFSSWDAPLVPPEPR